MKTSAAAAAQVIRPPACAGRFYPADPAQLREEVKAYLAAPKVSPGPAPKAIIAPHAGYIYSGPVAGTAYACLLAGRNRIQRVILLGPSHYADFDGLAASQADAFATPLGLVPLDKEAMARCRALPQIVFLEEAHRREHSLEVHLPFLQTILESFTVVPLLVGDATDGQISQMLETLWGGSETCIVVSSDLSHYHDNATARQLDDATSHAIAALRFEMLDTGQACGCRPIRGLLHRARQLGLRGRTVDLRNSGDTAGPRDRVVGYGAYVFAE
ncbi:MAG: AmmeMemoRadiSam system protein B [Chloroflexi bacterium]|nr:AmmeMemoRadiSam system protein B [Chloroflexota bacterium]